MLRATALACSLLCCAGQSASAQWSRLERPRLTDPQDKLFPLDATFQLISINGKPVNEGQSLTIDSSFRGSGFAGCNSWSAATYPIKGQRIAMGPVALTKKMCAPAIMAQERTFLYALHSGPNWTMEGPILTVKSRAGTLQFRRGF